MDCRARFGGAAGGGAFSCAQTLCWVWAVHCTETAGVRLRIRRRLYGSHVNYIIHFLLGFLSPI